MRAIKRSIFPWYYIFGLGLRHIIDGVVMVITIGNYTTAFSLQYVMRVHKRRLKQTKTTTI